MTRRILTLTAGLIVRLAALPAPAQPPPAATLGDDLKGPGPVLVNGYTEQHPRLLVTALDRDALAAKAKDQPVRWQAVLDSARRLGAAPPPAEEIKAGKAYWRVERVESGALAAFVTGDKKLADEAAEWLVAYTAVDTWGTGFRPNLDLEASWNLYHLSIAYDLLYPSLSDADRKSAREGLAAHAKAIADSFDPAAQKENYRFDQNHTYIPATALTAAALALQREVPEATQWLKLAAGVMNRCRYVLGTDGYYYEGYGYWSYALHWHVRYAELMGRATGQNLFDLPALRDNWKFALHLSLPGNPGAFDVGDIGQWKDDIRTPVKVTNHGMLWATAKALKLPGARTAGDLYDARSPEADYPAAAFLWFASDVQAAALEKITPWQYFADEDVIAWRSGWDKDATALLFRCGPPEGHAASDKLQQLKDWTPNAGHVHPDIGAFYFYARGAYLATSTGYTVEKWTKDHNTLLIDGKGQAVDGDYHNDRAVPYEQLDACKIEAQRLTDRYAYARGTFGSAYTRQVKGVELKRTILTTKNWLLIIDDMKSDQPHTLTWLCHADAPFTGAGPAHLAKLPNASLAVLPLAGEVDAKAEPTTVIAGLKPGQGTATQRGHQLSLTLKSPAAQARVVNLLVPLSNDQQPPTVADAKLDGSTITLQIRWPDGKSDSVSLNLAWQSEGDPATIK
jgi:hypothetical protein